MLNPRDEYNFLKNINNIKDIAYYELFEKYMVENKKGDAKLTEIESTDQESLIITKNGGYPIPGMIYTFMYGEPDQIALNVGAKNFIDAIPLTFCMNIERGSFKGLNMNMLPSSVRLDFFDSFYETFKDFFAREAEVLAQNRKIALNKRFIEFMKSGGGQEMLKLFNRRSGENFNFAYRSYKIEKVKQLRMIEYNEWLYIPFLEPKEAFRMINQSQMHKLYYKQR
jgi:hypothetical protein